MRKKFLQTGFFISVIGFIMPLPIEVFAMNQEDQDRATLARLQQQGEQGGAALTLKNFNEMDEIEYENSIREIFNLDGSKQEKAESIRKWSDMAGVPVLALNRHSLFFYANLHVCPPTAAPAIEFNTNEGKGQAENYSTKLSEEGEEILVKDRVNRHREVGRRKATPNLKKHTLYYVYGAKYGGFTNAQTQYKAESDNHYANFPIIKQEISYDFLQDYIIPLHEIKYLDEIINGLKHLPKSVVEVMKGKALYLSSERGMSATIITSHNLLIVNYLGLMSGVFVERHKDKRQITETLIHKIGQLIDYTVLQKVYVDTKGNRSIPFPYQFVGFHTLYEKRERLFRGNVLDLHQKHKVDGRVKGKPGFITHYAEQDCWEDFAEHFVHYILENNNFLEAIKEDREKADSHTLLHKFGFMKKMIEKTSAAYAPLVEL